MHACRHRAKLVVTGGARRDIVARRSSLGPASAQVIRSTVVLMARPDDVVPVTVEVVAVNLQLEKLLGGDLLAGRIATTIEPCTYDETSAVGRVADQVDDRLEGP